MRILLLGWRGQVGWELRRSLGVVGEVTAIDVPEVDLAEPASAVRVIDGARPDVVVNAAAYTAVDRAETEERVAHAVNAESVGAIARAMAGRGGLLVHYSTDYVFGGSGTRPWREDDRPAPVNAYGRSKLAGERAIAESGCRHLLFRTSWVYAARGQNFVRTILRLASERDALRVISDQHGVPTAAEFLADVTAIALLRVLQGGNARQLLGTYHLAPRGETSWHGIAVHAVGRAASLGAALTASPGSIAAIPASGYPLPAPRPANSRLCVDKVERAFGIRCPDWREHLDRTVAELVQGPNA